MDTLELIEQGKVKRLFSSRKKLSYPGAIGHITQRASGKEPLFLEDCDYLYMLYLLKEITSEYKIDVFSFVLMPNHVHLLLRQNEDNLPKAMQSLFERYAKYFNLKYERKGHLFCGPYRMALCFDDSYLLAASLYIHLNPLKAGLCENPVDYRWSSIRLYRSGIDKETFLNYKFILQILDEDISSARMKYKKFLENAGSIKIKNILEDFTRLEEFRLELLPIFSWACQENKNWDIFDEKKLNKEVQLFKNKKRLKMPHEIKARKFLIEQLLARGYKKAEIAEKLNLSRQAIYDILN